MFPKQLAHIVCADFQPFYFFICFLNDPKCSRSDTKHWVTECQVFLKWLKKFRLSVQGGILKVDKYFSLDTPSVWSLVPCRL